MTIFACVTAGNNNPKPLEQRIVENWKTRADFEPIRNYRLPDKTLPRTSHQPTPVSNQSNHLVLLELLCVRRPTSQFIGSLHERQGRRWLSDTARGHTTSCARRSNPVEHRVLTESSFPPAPHLLRRVQIDGN